MVSRVHGFKLIAQGAWFRRYRGTWFLGYRVCSFSLPFLIRLAHGMLYSIG